MGCKECGKPKCNGKCGCKSPKVLQINNPAEYITFHKVSIPAAMGDSTTNPPRIGAYRNALVYYEADHTSWMYSTDGIPTKLTNGLTDYNEAVNLPQINGHTLIGNQSSSDLGIQGELTAGANIQINGNTISATNTTYTAGNGIELDGTEIKAKIGDGLEFDSNGEIVIADIEQYAHFFDTVADMQAADLSAGEFAVTAGYHAVNDGGGAKYKIANSSETADGGSIIALNNNLKATLIIENGEVNVKQFGAYGDGTHDDTTAIQKCLTKYDTVYLLSGTYLISQSLKLKENNSLIGESKSNTSLTTNEDIILIEPKDNYIKNISIENISLLGNYHATSGICLYKTSNPDFAHTDTNIRIKSVYVNRCTNWCVMLGRSDDENSLPNTVVDDLTIEQFTGGGLFLSSRCTDSMFENVFVGGGSVGTKPNIQVEGYDLHFNNCKSYYSGKSDNHQDAWYFDGAAVISGEIEAQDSYKYGVEFYQSKYINLSIITDKCGEISSNYPAIYINDSGFMNLNISCSNAENNNIYNTKSCVKLNRSTNINMDIVKQNNVDYLFDNTGEFPNTSDIKFSLNGNEVIDVTPVFDTQNYNSNGIKATTIGENKILISGTATADVSLALKGSYGSSAVLSHIPSGNVVNTLTNSNTQFQVFYNRTTVWTSTTKQNIKATTANIDITGLVLKIPNNTVINAVVTPKILITSNS